MLKKTLTISFIVASSFVAHSQIGIGTTSPKASSRLDITATDKGLLIPRIALLSNTDILTILAPEKSLLIYNTATTSIGNTTDVKEGFYYFDGTTWLPISSGDTPIQLTNGNYHTSNTTSGTSGTDNYFIGKDAGTVNTGSFVTALGVNSGKSNTKDFNQFIGLSSGQNNTGSRVTAIGVFAGANNEGGFCELIGSGAGSSNKAENLIAIGSESGSKNEGIWSNIIGRFAGYKNTGNFLNAMGVQVADSNTGMYVNAIGYNTAANNTGHHLQAIGEDAGLNNTGTSTIAIGYRTGVNNQGIYNTFIGSSLEQKITGSHNILMGYSVELSSLTGSNQINLANRIVVNENSFVGLGGITEPKEKLHVDAANDSLQVDNLAGVGQVLNINAEGKIFRSSANMKSALIKTADYTIGASDEVILADATSADVTITFPVSPVDGQTHTVKRINGTGNNVILNGNGNDLDGLTTRTMSVGYQFYTYLFHTNNWYLINQ